MVEYQLDRSIRVKVNNDCQWTCTFCHNEGTELPSSANAAQRVSIFSNGLYEGLPPIENMEMTGRTLLAFDSLQHIGVNEAHLTGGEPTLHPGLPWIVSALRKRSLTVKMTTNGQSSPLVLRRIIEAGLSGINFSVLSFDPSEFLKTQNPPYIPGMDPIQWAIRMIQREKANIILAESFGMPVKINTVVLGGEDCSRVDSVREFAQENGVTLVLLNEIEGGEESLGAAVEYAERYGQYLGSVEHTNSSKGSRRYRLGGTGELRVKYLTAHHPEVVCKGCEHQGRSTCAEKFYGLRMEFRGGEPYVRLCVQKTNKQTVMPFSEFIKRDIQGQLRATTASPTRRLKNGT